MKSESALDPKGGNSALEPFPTTMKGLVLLALLGCGVIPLLLAGVDSVLVTTTAIAIAADAMLVNLLAWKQLDKKTVPIMSVLVGLTHGVFPFATFAIAAFAAWGAESLGIPWLYAVTQSTIYLVALILLLYLVKDNHKGVREKVKSARQGNLQPELLIEMGGRSG